MIFQLTVIGCDDHDFGEERIILEDDQLGKLTMREIEVDSLAEALDLLDEADTVQFNETNWDRYDGEMTIICGNLF